MLKLQDLFLFFKRFWRKREKTTQSPVEQVVLSKSKKKYFEFELTEAQQISFEALKEFAMDKTAKVFILRGYAGTGKTTLVAGYIKWLVDNKKLFNLLASTGRAAKVLSDKTNVKVETVHSHIYIFSEINQDMEKLAEIMPEAGKAIKLNYSLKVKDPDVEPGHLYLIDESSMISDVVVENDSFAHFGSGKLLNDLFAFDTVGKFVFIGDPKQLPPVGQTFSPALSSAYIKKIYQHNVVEHELTTIKRQADNNDIIKASMNIRKLHEINPNVRFASFPLKGHRDILIHSSVDSFTDLYVETIRKHDFQFTTMICHTNRQCGEFNRIIRHLLGKPPDKPMEGDILMITQNNALSGLVNGDFVQIMEVKESKYYCGLNFISLVVEELNFKERFEIMMIENLLFSNLVNITQQEHRRLLIDFVYRMKAENIRPNNPAFSKLMNKDIYLNAHKAKFGYAVTCHKCQGGEWQEVFLFMNNKIHGIPKPGIYQWLYTAVTRAKSTLHVIDDWYIK
ncbi:MAG TPA: helicase [Saprospirales bacterium]|nr:helicase [Saprospirales bacterium]HRQ28804.1 AAA family ATPase [Saprospiraceae bacterium]